MLKIAVPNKGTLSEESVKLAIEAGYNCKRYSRELVVSDPVNNIEFFFLRPRDIAVYVSKGILDLGITGRDLALDSLTETNEILPLGFGHSSFKYAVPDESKLSFDNLNEIKIATSYPNLVSMDLKKRGLKAEIIKLDGAIEISIHLGVADAIADVVQTGRTLIEAGLKTIGDSILDSEAVLISRNSKILNNTIANNFIERLKGIIVAREYNMVEYDVHDDSLKKAIDITPGIEAPTVAPLSKEKWYAVKAMAKKKNVNKILDDLTNIGAKGIIVTDIRTCRM